MYANSLILSFYEEWRHERLLIEHLIDISSGSFLFNKSSSSDLQALELTLHTVWVWNLQIPSQCIRDKDMAMGAILCLYESVDDSVAAQPNLPANATLNENILFYLGQICSIRTRLRTCAQQLIEYLAPCNSPTIQAHIGDMKTAVTSLFSTFCDDDMAQVRRFLNDGAVACIEDKNTRLDNCTANMVDLVTNMPIESKTFEAIEMCHKYDQMVSCSMNILNECPKPSTREFMENIFSLFRSGTYCRVTVPETSEDRIARLTADRNIHAVWYEYETSFDREMRLVSK
ncbi:unnamed protein product [Diatraea saccharalis]|uniref:Uncharacterized protein n=1 Tax=Diatraea saccharalis TaxID=40085 RepID=A0A9N9QWQ1_9NEOP|nr:unnamed protein product [Diatraea saccharalis]